MTTTNELVHQRRQDGVLILTLDDPSARNALSPEMAEQFYAAVDEFEANPEDRVLVLTGADPSFCSGANIRRFNETIEELSPGTSEKRAASRAPRPLSSRLHARLVWAFFGRVHNALACITLWLMWRVAVVCVFAPLG